MFLILQHKENRKTVEYIRIERVASRSILGRLGFGKPQMEPVFNNKVEIADIQKPKDIVKRYEKALDYDYIFTFVRNPYDRFLSIHHLSGVSIDKCLTVFEDIDLKKLWEEGMPAYPGTTN